MITSDFIYNECYKYLPIKSKVKFKLLKSVEYVITKFCSHKIKSRFNVFVFNMQNRIIDRMIENEKLQMKKEFERHLKIRIIKEKLDK